MARRGKVTTDNFNRTNRGSLFKNRNFNKKKENMTKSEKLMNGVATWCSFYRMFPHVFVKDYFGIDLSQVQTEMNVSQFFDVSTKYTDIQGNADWCCSDSEVELDRLVSTFDMVFTCPPYYNLEKYTNDPKDLSNLPTYSDFLHKYSSILHKSAQKLEPNSFFVIVVSEIRASMSEMDKSYYRGFVPDTIQILRDHCGLHYYNEIILENAIGSLPIRAPKNFDRSRKIGRHHQNILVFYKGDISAIEKKFGKISM